LPLARADLAEDSGDGAIQREGDGNHCCGTPRGFGTTATGTRHRSARRPELPDCVIVWRRLGGVQSAIGREGGGMSHGMPPIHRTLTRTPGSGDANTGQVILTVGKGGQPRIRPKGIGDDNQLHGGFSNPEACRGAHRR
jgi:hypothetical protein